MMKSILKATGLILAILALAVLGSCKTSKPDRDGPPKGQHRHADHQHN